jgi:type VI secretion system secreted protein VgrG
VKLGDISIKADMGSITVEALQTITLKVGQSSVTLSQAGVEVKGMVITIDGQALTEVKGTMVTVEGAAMLTLKGGVTMIN